MLDKDGTEKTSEQTSDNSDRIVEQPAAAPNEAPANPEESHEKRQPGAPAPQSPYWSNPDNGPWNPSAFKDPFADSNPDETREFRSARSLMTASNIMGPVSIFIGGIFLSGCGIACAVMSMKKFNRLAASSDNAISSLSGKMARAAKASIAICVLALAVNAISAALIFPTVLEAVESGQIEGLLSGQGDSGFVDDAGNTPSEVWG